MTSTLLTTVSVELPNIEDAVERAMKDALFTSAETIKAAGRIAEPSHDIEDESGYVLETMRFSNAVEVEP